MQYFVLGIAILAGLLLLARWLSTTDPRVLAWLVRVVGGVVGAAVLGYVFFAGRLHWLLYALPFALPFFFHWRSNQLRRRNASGPTPGQSSTVATEWFDMVLDHDTGDMEGTVTRGPFAGRSLGELSQEELLELLDACAADEDSARLLEAYLDRVHGSEWRSGADEGAGPGAQRRTPWGAAMTPEEAFEVLGIEPGASEAEIRAAHRKLMAKLHPDHGGSTYLAAKLNQAKDLLLKG
jgi:hypothetical protein